MSTKVVIINKESHKQSLNSKSEEQSSGKSNFQFVDNRPEAIAQQKLQKMANNSPQAKHVTQLQMVLKNYSARQQQPIQKKENNTGLPDRLKSGIENLSGFAMDDVKVHYNSYKPAQLRAHAYAQGTDIHIAPGKEKHLPHEAWHVVQQKQGRVAPIWQMMGKVNINDDHGLEKEADVMGVKAVQVADNRPEATAHRKIHKTKNKTIQRLVGSDLEPGDPVIVKELKRVYYIFKHVEGLGYTVSSQPDAKKKEALYLYDMLDYQKPFNEQKLIPLKGLPEAPKQYIRINSFAFAKSKKLPVASHSYLTCLGVIIHDHRQKMGGMAHIDTDEQESIAEKTRLVIDSVKAMIKSINPKKYGDLDINLFAGLGLAGKDNFKGFLKAFTTALTHTGIDARQIHPGLTLKNSAKLAVYFPEQGKFYLDGRIGKDSSISTIKERSIKRLTYDGDDYEDQEKIKEDIITRKAVIIEVEFDDLGGEVAHTKYAPNPFYPSSIMGVEPLTGYRNPVQKKQINRN